MNKRSNGRTRYVCTRCGLEMEGIEQLDGSVRAYDRAGWNGHTVPCLCAACADLPAGSAAEAELRSAPDPAGPGGPAAQPGSPAAQQGPPPALGPPGRAAPALAGPGQLAQRLGQGRRPAGKPANPNQTLTTVHGCAPVRVDVPQRDIDEGLRIDPSRCPLALALSRALGRPVGVGHAVFFFNTGTTEEVHTYWELPSAMQEWERKFDAEGRDAVQPETFWLELKPGVRSINKR